MSNNKLWWVGQRVSQNYKYHIPAILIDSAGELSASNL